MEEPRRRVLRSSLSWNCGTFLLAVGKPRCSRGLLSSSRPVEHSAGLSEQPRPNAPTFGESGAVVQMGGASHSPAPEQTLAAPTSLRREESPAFALASGPG